MINRFLNIYHNYGIFILIGIWTCCTVLFGILTALGKYSLKEFLIMLIPLVLCIAFIAWDKFSKSHNPIEYGADFENNKKDLNLPNRLVRILDVIFVFGVILILFILQYCAERPLAYFIICSILAIIIIISILFSPNPFSPVRHIIKIIVLSLVTTFSIFKTEYWMGNDTWVHAAMNEVIADVGYVFAVMAKEGDFPLQHIAVAISEIMPAVDVRIGSLIAVAVPSILCSFSVYIILKKIIGEKFALIGLLLSNISAALISWRILSQTTSYGIVLIITLIMLYYSLVNTDEKKYNVRYFILFICIGVTLTLTHLFSTFMFIFILIGIYFGAIIFHKRLFCKEIIYIGIILLVAMLVWSVLPNGLNTVFNTLGTMASSFANTGIIIPDIDKYVNITPDNDIISLLGSPNIFIYTAVLLIIYLSMKYAFTKSIKSYILHTIAAAYGFLFFAYFMTYILSPSMVGRFIPLNSFYCAISIAIILWYVIHKVSSVNMLCIFAGILIILVGIFCLSNLSSTAIAIDNPIWDKTATNSAVSIGDHTGMRTTTSYIPEYHNTIYYENNNLGRCLESLLYLIDYQKQHNVPQITQRSAYDIDIANWNEIESKTDDYLIYREDLRYSATSQRVYYSTGKYVTQTIKVPEIQLNRIRNNNNIFYSNGDITTVRLR